MHTKKKLFIHGGSSLISIYFIKHCINEYDEIHIFSRNIAKTKNLLKDLDQKKIIHYENNLSDINITLDHIKKLPNDLTGVLWVTGKTGDPEEEIKNISFLKENLKVNFLNPVICINEIVNKMIFDIPNSFICVITSVAGLRGRNKRLFYGSAKGGLINFLSALRQRLNGKIKVVTVIPGYIDTEPFSETAPGFLIASPEKFSKTIIKGIKKNKEIIYINFIWKIIMFFINLIPEKIFKKLSF